MDLKAAYKQLVRGRSDAAIAVIAVYNPHSKEVELYEEVSLPFRSAASVIAFNRMGVALRRGLIRYMRICCTSFYDECLEFEKLVTSASADVLNFLRLLGWKVAEDKLKEYRPQFEALGVEFDFLGIPTKGVIVVGNTARRRQQVGEEINRLIQAGFVAVHEAASLRGRIAFQETQHWSRIGSLACKKLAARANGSGVETTPPNPDEE